MLCLLTLPQWKENKQAAKRGEGSPTWADGHIKSPDDFRELYASWLEKEEGAQRGCSSIALALEDAVRRPYLSTGA